MSFFHNDTVSDFASIYVANITLSHYRERFLDLVEGRSHFAGLTMMKDISLKGVKGVSGERTVNKIQDFVWDECLGTYSLLPEVCLKSCFLQVAKASVFNSLQLFFMLLVFLWSKP